MKLGKSKLALAKVINENGGWADDSANWAVQPEHEEGDIWFSSSDNKPYRNKGMDGFAFDGRGLWLDDVIKHNKLPQNWHQCVLSREEYYQAYPEADADGWIEWKADGKSDGPIGNDVPVDVKLRCGSEHFGQLLSSGSWMDLWGDESIVAYRPHKQKVEPEFCESVMRSIPEQNAFELEYDPSLVQLSSGRIGSESIDELCARITEENKHRHVDAKPTIEQLAQDYRNKLDFAKRKQQEADDAKVAADAALGELERAGEALGLLIGIAKPDREQELVITDWRDLRVNDVIFVGEYDDCESGEYVVIELEGIDCGYDYAVKAAGMDGNGRWIDTTKEWRFIRRP